MCVCGCGYVGCKCVCGPAAGAARLRIEYVVRMRARARGDLVCCSCNSVAENIVRDHASPVTHSRHASAYAVRRTRVRCDTVALLEAGTPSSRLSGCGRGRGGPGPGGWLPEQPAAWKPQTLHTQPQPMLHRNLRQCPHALSVPRRAHVPPAEAHLRPLPPASPIPCAEAGRSMSRPHRPRRRRLLCRVPSRSPAPFVVVFPMPICAVVRPRAACCSPPSPPARPCHVPWLAQVSPAPPSASPHSYATCAVALDCASLGVGALSCHVPLRSTFAVALDCASLGVAALSCRVPLRLTAPFVVDAVAQECSCLQNQGCGKNQSRPDGHKWRGESRLRSTLGALVGLATILRRRSARPHEDIVPHQTFG